MHEAQTAIHRLTWIPKKIQITERRYLAVLSSLIAWSGCNGLLWAENFNCHLLEVLDHLLSDEGVMDDFLTNYHRNNSPRALRRLHVRYVIYHVLSDLILNDEVLELL